MAVMARFMRAIHVFAGQQKGRRGWPGQAGSWRCLDVPLSGPVSRETGRRLESDSPSITCGRILNSVESRFDSVEKFDGAGVSDYCSAVFAGLCRGRIRSYGHRHFFSTRL